METMKAVWFLVENSSDKIVGVSTVLEKVNRLVFVDVIIALKLVFGLNGGPRLSLRHVRFKTYTDSRRRVNNPDFLLFYI